MTTDPVRAEITEKGPFYIQRKSVFLPNNAFYPKKHPKFLKTDIYFGKGYFFLCTTFSGCGQNMVRTEKWVFVFFPEISVFGPKIQFLPYDPNFSQRPVCSPQSDRSLPTFGAIFDILFLSWGCFRKKKNLGDASSGLPPPHCEGTVCQ